MKFPLGRTLLLALAALAAPACGGEEPPGHTHDGPVDVALTFKPRVGTQPFACGQTYTGLGTTGATYEPKDFRLYVHNVRLINHSYEEVPLALKEDGAWQRDGVVLLDFEDKTGLCTNGTQAMNDRIVGTVPGNHYVGLRFTVGLPFEKNHQDASIAKAPFNVSTLFWGWEGGYTFIRLDGRTAGLPAGHNFHLGSTGCQTSGPNQVTSCQRPNRFDVEIANFDPTGAGGVVLDIAALFAGSNLDTNQAQTAAGCMSESKDDDCAPIFQRLGLGFGSSPGTPGAQAFFRKE
jgi:uncharacterized repeat protein (TIGR04052 family)